MKIPFDIKYRPQIESGEYKVETKNGLQVEILRFDIKSDNFPIVGIISHSTGGEMGSSWRIDGGFYSKGSSESDLVLITPKPELTDFEEKIASIIYHYSDELEGDCRECAKEEAPRLLDAARKALRAGD